MAVSEKNRFLIKIFWDIKILRKARFTSNSLAILIIFAEYYLYFEWI